MRIPQYDNKVAAPNAPQFNNTADLRNDSLSELADGIGQVYQVLAKEKEEAQKTAFFQADTSIKMELATAKHDLLEKIKNGGSYADAEAQYQKAHDATIAKYSSVYDQDKSGNTKLRAMAEYQAEGLQNVMQIRDTATSRRRSDTASSASLRMEQLKRDYALAETPEKRQAALSAMSGTMASLSSTGIITGAEGKSKLTGVIQGAEADRLALFSQNNADNPKAVLEEVERSKNNLSVDAYISARGQALNEIERLDVNKQVIEKLATNPTEMTQNEVDRTFNIVLESGVKAGTPEYNTSIIEVAKRTGSIPSQLDIQASSILSSDPATIKTEDAQTFANFAMMTKSMPLSAVGKLSEETQAAINFVNDSIEANISVENAVKQSAQAIQALNDPRKADQEFESFSSKQLYKDGNDYLAEKVDQTVLGRLFDIGPSALMPGKQGYTPTSQMRKIYDTRAFMYSKMGKDLGSAQKMAYQDVAKIYQPFEGKMIKYSPRAVYGIGDGEFKKNAVIAPLKSSGLFNEKYEYQIQSDGQTELEVKSNKPATYQIYIKDDEGVLGRLRDSDGVGLRTKVLKVKGYEPFISVGPLLLNQSDRDKYNSGELQPWLQK